MKQNALRFLVVDDDALLRMTTESLLRGLNAAEVYEAADGAKALDMLHAPETAIDIVLCDLNMPGMDGMEFLRHLGTEHSHVSVILVSSHDDTLMATVDKMARAYGVKLLGTLHKPVSKEKLAGVVVQYKPSQAKAPRPAGPSFSIDEIMQGIREKQFEPFYQPKVDFRTGLVCGTEALARWIHPEHGIIAPYAFIQLLEASSNENITALTFLILEKSAAACRKLHDQGYKISVSVNLSLNLLDDPTLAEKITQIVRGAGAEPGHIILEVTESAAMTNVAHSLENLARLKMRGFGISIDDYGTGFSNIQQITRIACDELKIDQSFVKDCTGKQDLCVIIRSSIEMAHQLKIKCTAEGVETKEDWDTLKSMNCDVAQGYFIAKPMNLSSFLDFCAAHSAQDLLR